ncbi:hypothetical protein Syun_030014 [Stephania yunnanensis]|uniref:Transposase-associated domain-containing protein n=1 Tax=Stephania yunnanensis TaxID=152371 RepID=A0AAP0E909_9MAGN
MSSTSRDWMYNRLNNGFVRIEFAARVKEFIAFAKQHCPIYQSERKIICPCDYKKCRLVPYLDVETVEYHICRYGFVSGYHCWYEHGENGDDDPQSFYQFDNHIDDADVGGFDTTTYHEMLHNVAGPSFNWNHVEESPNPQARQLYDMIEASSEQLWSGCETMTTLSAMARLLAIKSKHHISERWYNEIIKFMKDCLSNDNSLVENFYATKRLMRGLGLPVEKIDCCEDQSWKHFNDVNRDFAAEVRNVRLGLCTDGFQVFEISGKLYSSWSDKLQMRRLELTQATPDQLVDDEAVYFNVSGECPKGRVMRQFGMTMDGASLSQPQPPPPPPPPPHDQQQPPQIDPADPPQQQDNVEREMQDWLTRDEQLVDT